MDSCIHYKFSSVLDDYSTVKFRGLEISRKELTNLILEAKKLTNTPLEIINAQTKKPYTNENDMIPRNTSVIVKRLPLWSNKSSKETAEEKKKLKKSLEKSGKIELNDDYMSLISDMSNSDAITEAEKIKRVQMQVELEFGQKNCKPPRSKPSASYRCHRCQKPGHFKGNCPTLSDPNFEAPKKLPIGIPSNMLVHLDSTSKDLNNENNIPNTNVYVDKNGRMVIHKADELASKAKFKRPKRNNTAEDVSNTQQRVTPQEITCKLCKDLLKDAVSISCCNDNFCDECIRNHLLNKENFTCPSCFKEDVGPENLASNINLRKAVREYRVSSYGEKYAITTTTLSTEDKKNFNISDSKTIVNELFNPKTFSNHSEIIKTENIKKEIQVELSPPPSRSFTPTNRNSTIINHNPPIAPASLHSLLPKDTLQLMMQTPQTMFVPPVPPPPMVLHPILSRLPLPPTALPQTVAPLPIDALLTGMFKIEEERLKNSIKPLPGKQPTSASKQVMSEKEFYEYQNKLRSKIDTAKDRKLERPPSLNRSRETTPSKLIRSRSPPDTNRARYLSPVEKRDNIIHHHDSNSRDYNGDYLKTRRKVYSLSSPSGSFSPKIEDKFEEERRNTEKREISKRDHHGGEKYKRSPRLILPGIRFSRRKSLTSIKSRKLDHNINNTNRSTRSNDKNNSSFKNDTNRRYDAKVLHTTTNHQSHRESHKGQPYLVTPGVRRSARKEVRARENEIDERRDKSVKSEKKLKEDTNSHKTPTTSNASKQKVEEFTPPIKIIPRNSNQATTATTTTTTTTTTTATTTTTTNNNNIDDDILTIEEDFDSLDEVFNDSLTCKFSMDAETNTDSGVDQSRLNEYDHKEEHTTQPRQTLGSAQSIQTPVNTDASKSQTISPTTPTIMSTLSQDDSTTSKHMRNLSLDETRCVKSPKLSDSVDKLDIYLMDTTDMLNNISEHQMEELSNEELVSSEDCAMLQDTTTNVNILFNNITRDNSNINNSSSNNNSDITDSLLKENPLTDNITSSNIDQNIKIEEQKEKNMDEKECVNENNNITATTTTATTPPPTNSNINITTTTTNNNNNNNKDSNSDQNLSRARLQSIVKKLNSGQSFDRKSRGAESNTGDTPTQSAHGSLAREIISPIYADKDSNIDSSISELEDGQVLSSGSGSRTGKRQKKQRALRHHRHHHRHNKHDHDKDTPLSPKSKLLSPVAVSRKLSSPRSQPNSSLQRETRYNTNKQSSSTASVNMLKSPDRIVIMKSMPRCAIRSREAPLRYEYNRTVSQDRAPQIYRRHPPLIRRQPRLLMTKTDDKRIVEIKTNKRHKKFSRPISYTSLENLRKRRKMS